jgi:hypothetical protein
MDDPALTKLSIEIASSGATDEEIDRMTRQLLSALKETEIESAELARGEPAPIGSKGDAMTIGSIAVQVLPALLPGIVGLVQTWAAHAQGRTVKFKAQGIEFEGSSEDLQRLLVTLGRGKKK